MAVLEVSGLAIGYDGVPVASGISLRVPDGASLLVIGHNGAGKSTLLRSLFGLHPLLRGNGTVGGIDIKSASPRELYIRGFRYLGQGIRSFNGLSIATSRRVLQRLYGFPAAADSIFGSSWAPAQFGKRIGQLSVGQKRLEALALLSAGSPRAFFLDEPTAGLDPRHSSEISAWIRRRKEAGISFVVVEQQFRGLLAFFDLAAVMRRGEVSYFGAAASLRDAGRLGEVFL